MFAVNLHFKLCLCPAKLWINNDFAPQNYGAMQTVPREITKPTYVAPQNHRAIILCPTKLWSNEGLAPQNHGDIVSDAKITTWLSFLFFYFFLITYFSEIFVTIGITF